MTLNQIVKTTFDTLRAQLSGLEKRVETLEKKAQKAAVQLQARFGTAATEAQRIFAGVGKQLQTVVTFATRSEVQSLAGKLEELSEKVDKLSRSERLRPPARKSEAA